MAAETQIKNLTKSYSAKYQYYVVQEFTMGRPNSLDFMYSASRCSAAGLCVIVVTRTLSVSVTVRRMGWSKVCPNENCSK